MQMGSFLSFSAVLGSWGSVASVHCYIERHWGSQYPNRRPPSDLSPPRLLYSRMGLVSKYSAYEAVKYDIEIQSAFSCCSCCSLFDVHCKRRREPTWCFSALSSPRWTLYAGIPKLVFAGVRRARPRTGVALGTTLMRLTILACHRISSAWLRSQTTRQNRNR